MLTDLDEALQRLHATDLECRDGSVNTGTVVAVSLELLGHPALIPAFGDLYRPRLQPLPEGGPLADEEVPRALGDRARRADWLATFEGELAREGPEAVLARWLPQLLHGAFAVGGPVRTSLACISLSKQDDHLRRRELAFGLAQWASRFQVLPGSPGARPVKGRRVAEVMDRVEGVASDRRRIGPMNEAVLELEGDAGFAAELSSADLFAEAPDDAVRALVDRTAEFYLAHPESRVVYGESIKTSVALLELMKGLPEAERRLAAGRALQAALAVHAVYGTGVAEASQGGQEDLERNDLAASTEEIRYRAACSGQPQAITVAEACLRAHSTAGTRGAGDVLLQVAADAALRFESTHAGRGG